MAKIAFLGAGSTIFAKAVLGDCLHVDALRDARLALIDLDPDRLHVSQVMLENINRTLGASAKIEAYLAADAAQGLAGADYVVNAIQVGGYEPATVTDFEIPKKYGLRQTIADTLGIGGIFRALRTIPVMLDFARDMEAVCPNAWLLNYTNPMSMLTGAMLRGSGVKTVGLCHSVQVGPKSLLETVGMWKPEMENTVRAKIAGINHMAWLLEITENGKDLYPEIKKLADKKLNEWRKAPKDKKSGNMIRLEIMRKFGYYVTESSEHNAEYMPYWIKSNYPELIEEYNIPLDEYPRRCINQIANWKKQYKDVCENPKLTHTRTHEYGSGIMEAIVTNVPYQIGGNVMNTGLISNLPSNCVVEVPCLVDSNGVQGTFVGALPPQCAALNMTNVNVHLLAVEAALTGKKEHLYHAAMLDPHTSAELSLDDIVKMCNELIKAHGDMLPKFK